MKNKKLFSIISSLAILFIGIFLLVFPNLIVDVDNVNTLFYTIMYIYAMIIFCDYFITREDGDYEKLFTALACTLAGTSGIIFNLESTPMVLSLTLISWVSIMAIIKLIKVDYLMDRNNKMWNVKIVLFGSFILIGILTSINLYYEITTQTLILGFFFLINGLLELSYPLIEGFYDKYLDKFKKDYQKEIKKEITKTEIKKNKKFKKKVS